MNELEKLPNISKVIASNLEKAGIKTVEQLRIIGSKEAYLRIRLYADKEACINMLYALEGAMQGIRWHGLEPAKKEELKQFYASLG